MTLPVCVSVVLSFPQHPGFGGRWGAFVGRIFLSLQEGPLPPRHFDSSHQVGWKGGRRGAARRRGNLTLGGHFTVIQCSESIASSHFQQERFPFPRHFNLAARKADREVHFWWAISFSEAGRSRGGCDLPAGFQESKLILCNLSGCGTVLCVWCARGE
jgi:hypothetical protein